MSKIDKNFLQYDKSQAEILASLPAAEKKKILSGFSDAELRHMHNSWEFWARPKQLLPAGDWMTWFIVSGRGFGKALPLTTPIPTPSGWTTMEELQVGDQVLDESGKPCNVTFVTDVQHGRSCYQITFYDGQTVVADADHQWSVSTIADRLECPASPKQQVMTTLDLIDNLCSAEGEEFNLAIELCSEVQYPTKQLQIDPYLLGVWLGSSRANKANITCDWRDKEIVDRLEARGFKILKKARNIYEVSTGKLEQGNTIWSNGFEYSLKQLKLTYNKHVPLDYLTASVDQRYELLRGLMDAAGTVVNDGKCEFASINKQLAEDVLKLTSSLGIKVEPIKACAHKATSVKYTVSFYANKKVFSIKRKTELLNSRLPFHASRRYIKNINAVESVPVKCIQVDSPNSLFLCEEYFLVTHNTRTGAETIRQWVKDGYKRLALIGQTKSDVRDTMLFGESGLMTICQGDAQKPEYIASKRVVRWPNGAQAFLYSGDEPEQLRGPQHEKGWIDELVKFKKAEECWDNFILGLRLGDNPQCVCTTTPKPLPLIKQLLTDEETYVTTGSTYENYGNLSHKFIKHVVKKYEGTKLGKQELWGKLLEDIEGALWKWDLLNQLRVKAAPPLKRIVVAIDPASTSKETSDETGIVAVGLGKDNNAYVLSDVSNIYTPTDWAKAAIGEFKRLQADRIVAETNNGGEMVETVLRMVDATIPYSSVWASRGKYVRAEPVAGLYEQHRVFHVCENSESLNELEVEMTEWVPAEAKKSPNRVDALVWALSELILEKQEPRGKIRTLSRELRRALA